MDSQTYKIEDTSSDFVEEGAGDVRIREEPEKEIPDLPENREARNFLKNAPTKGLHMPLGKEVKVMQCWRCKAYGHRSGDAECSLSKSGNFFLDAQRQAREDPMSAFVAEKLLKKQEKYARVEQLMAIIAEIREEEAIRKKRKLEKKSDRKAKKEKKEKKEKKGKKEKR